MTTSTRLCTRCKEEPATHVVSLRGDVETPRLLNPNLCLSCAIERAEDKAQERREERELSEQRQREAVERATCPKCGKRVNDAIPLRPFDKEAYHRQCWFVSDERQAAKAKAEADDFDVSAFLASSANHTGHGLARGRERSVTFQGRTL